MMNTLLRSVLVSLAFSVLAAGQTKGTALLQHADHFTEMRSLVESQLRLTARRLPGISAEYRLAKGDIVGVEVLESQNLGGSFEIEQDGMISMSLVGDILAAGRTAMELEEDIGLRYASVNLIRSPEVLVSVLEYHGKPYYIFGEVDLAGQYIMSQQLTLLDAILIAGGLKGPAADFGYLHRRKEGAKEVMASASRLLLASPSVKLSEDNEVVKVDLRPVKEGRLLEEDILLQEGDVFVVPSQKLVEFYVIGEVMRPGAYDLPVSKEVYATQAVAQAGGPMKTAKTKEGILIRMNDAGERTEIPVDFKALLKGEKPDFVVQQNDVLFIPGSGAKTLAYGLLGSVPWRVQQGASQSIQ